MDWAVPTTYAARVLATRDHALDAEERAALRLGAHRIFDGGLCCGIEVAEDGGPERWELRVLALRGAAVEHVEEVVEESVRLEPDRGLRVVGYVPGSFRRADDLAPVVCRHPDREAPACG